MAHPEFVLMPAVCIVGPVKI